MSKRLSLHQWREVGGKKRGTFPYVLSLQLRQHEARCDLHKRKCHFCLKRVIARDLDAHLQTCDCRLVKCRHCGKNRLAAQLDSHEKMCAMRPQPCPACGVMVAPHDVQPHT